MSEIVIPSDEISQLANSIRKGLKLANEEINSGIDQTDGAANQVEPDGGESSGLQANQVEPDGGESSGLQANQVGPGGGESSGLQDSRGRENDDSDDIELVINSTVGVPTCTTPNTQLSASATSVGSFSLSGISTSSSSSSNTSASHPAPPANDQRPQGILFDKFQERHKSRLSALLDQRNTSGVPHWHHVMENIFETDETDETEITVKIADLYRAQHGGGNPPLMFLEHLKRRDEPVTKEDFRTKARKDYIKRFDIANHSVLMDREGSMLMKDLKLNEMLILAALLTSSNLLPDWKYFADEYNFPNDVKKIIAASINVANQTSPTKEMLNFFETKKKTTDDLKLACKKLVNVVRLIIEIENELNPKHKHKIF